LQRVRSKVSPIHPSFRWNPWARFFHTFAQDKGFIQAAGKKEPMDPVIEIVPSILSADFAILVEEIKRVEKAGCKRIHLDVMDGNFVPNITFGPVVIEAIRRRTNLYLEAHLMIDRPERYLHYFKHAGVNGVTVHQEACGDFSDALREIKRLGMDAGVALKPETPLENIKEVLSDLDYILIMTVEPGFGGQSVIPGSEEKIREVRELLREKKHEIPIEVDGGINAQTAPLVVKAGGTRLVAGHAVFNGNLIENIEELQKSVRSAQERLGPLHDAQ
jgi:ribulose-phosphate 3-epimerase